MHSKSTFSNITTPRVQMWDGVNEWVRERSNTYDRENWEERKQPRKEKTYRKRKTNRKNKSRAEHCGAYLKVWKDSSLSDMLTSCLLIEVDRKISWVNLPSRKTTEKRWGQGAKLLWLVIDQTTAKTFPLARVRPLAFLFLLSLYHWRTHSTTPPTATPPPTCPCKAPGH